MNKKKQILDFLKEDEFDIKALGKYDQSVISDISFLLEEKELISYTIEERSTESDYWLQVEYYSKKLNKTIIFSYDFYGGDTNEEFAEKIIKTEEDIEDLENRITLAQPETTTRKK